MSETVIPIVAVSGAGKDTIIEQLFERYPDRFRKFISTTTRAPRPGEVDGKDYYFIDDATYDQWEAEGRFLLSVPFAGARYGTLRSEVQGHGKTLLMLVVEGVAQSIKELLTPQGITVGIVAIEVSEQMVEQRMKARGDSPEQIQKRLEADRPRREAMRKVADVTVSNEGTLEEGVSAVEHAIYSFGG
jgi:guanylate kinase